MCYGHIENGFKPCGVKSDRVFMSLDAGSPTITGILSYIVM